MSNLFGSLTQYSLIYCLIIGLVLCLRGPVYTIAGARWAYALWFTLFIPLLIPLLPWLMPSSLVSSLMQSYAWLDQAKVIAGADSSGAFALAVVSIWLAGVLLAGSRAAYSSLRLKTSLQVNSQNLTITQQREFNKICSQLRVFPAPQVRVSPYIEGPALFGISSPVVYLPLGFFDRFASSERTLMLFHELCHYQRKDAWWNSLFCVLNCLFWFNPLFHIAQRRFRLDQEQSCDQFVLWDEPRVQRALYANAMLKIAAPSKSLGLIHFQSNAPEIVGRVVMLEQHKKTLPQSMFGFASLAALAITILIAAAPMVAASETIGVLSTWCSVYQGLSL